MTPGQDLEKVEIELLLEGLRRRYGYDFSNYSFSSLRRRLEQVRAQAGLARYTEVLDRVFHDEVFFDQVLRSLSITVTEMFRDPMFYRAVREHAVPHLRTFPFAKIWHAGCATGQEVYSMAILLQEENFLGRARLYATDFNKQALDTAQKGVYPAADAAAYKKNYTAAGGKSNFSDYFSDGYDFAKIKDSLKERITFSYHNLVTDGVFGEMNMICCRNVLIYFDRTLQDRVLRLFADSLRYGGFLCLGTKETLSFTAVKDLFEPVDAQQRIYKKIAEVPMHDAVVIGVSAGGMAALKVIFSALPATFALPIAVVQHLPEDSDSFLVEYLSQHCALRVKEAQDKEPMAAGTAYLAAPGYHLLLEPDRSFSLSVDPPVNFSRPSIDVLFESAAQVVGNTLIGVILTGASGDGSRGLKLIKEKGGLSVVQNPDTAEAGYMPRAALAATAADYVLELEQIAPTLARLGKKEEGKADGI